MVITQPEKESKASSSDSVISISSKDTGNGAGKEGLVSRIQREVGSRQKPHLNWTFLPINGQLAAQYKQILQWFCIFLVGSAWKQYFPRENTENSWNESKEICGEKCLIWGNMEGLSRWEFYQRNMEGYVPVSWPRACHITRNAWSTNLSKAQLVGSSRTELEVECRDTQTKTPSHPYVLIASFPFTFIP